MRCPQCKNKLLHKSGESVLLRTKGPLVFGQDGRCRTKCYHCKSEVSVPVRVQDGAVVPTEVFVMRK